VRLDHLAGLGGEPGVGREQLRVLARAALLGADELVQPLICASVFRVLGGERVSRHTALAGGGVSGVILLIPQPSPATTPAGSPTTRP
jgi:hypothetical protein